MTIHTTAGHLAATLLISAGLTTMVNAPSVAATASSAAVASSPGQHPMPWCRNTALLPRTADAAEQWLRQCGDSGSLPVTADAATSWLSQRR